MKVNTRNRSQNGSPGIYVTGQPLLMLHALPHAVLTGPSSWPWSGFHTTSPACTDNPHTFTLKYICTYFTYTDTHHVSPNAHTPLPIMRDYVCMYVCMPIVQHALSLRAGLALPAVDSGHSSSPVLSWVAGRPGRHPSSVVAWREAPACAGPPSQERLHRMGYEKYK